MKTILFIFICFSSYAQNKQDSIFIYFDVDEANSKLIEKNENAYKKINSLNGDESVLIVGCTDTTGSIQYNKKLAKQRIEDVQNHIKINFSTIENKIVGESSVFMGLDENRCVIFIYNRKAIDLVHKVRTLDTLVLNIMFVNNQDYLLPESIPIIQELYNFIDATNYVQIQLHGHVCCGPGQELSLKRAKRIRQYLTRHGVDVSKTKCFGHSNLQPRYPEVSEENEKKNRRVEVVVVVT